MAFSSNRFVFFFLSKSIAVVENESRSVFIIITCNIYSIISLIHSNVLVDYYIDTDEIPGFLLLLKNHVFTARSEHIIFLLYGGECFTGN